jgi:UDP-N-acetyl-2-amino-2-deoxyglucuronate dehydrogenase
MKNFALIGVAGYIAPRHLGAIRETGNSLLACLDKHDGVGILDSYFPQADFFTEFERFERHLEKLRRRSLPERVHYLAIASPNYLHDAHIRLALRIGAAAICEKPLVINPWNIDGLKQLEQEYQTRINAILQLRLHPEIEALKAEAAKKERRKIVLTYITSRGKWYHYSWKGSDEKSGGIITNIGVHFFDMLLWIYGECRSFQVHCREKDRAAGFLELERADVSWYLSLRSDDLPAGAERTHRSLAIDGRELEFSMGFTDLHTRSYREILSGKGFGLEDARPGIDLVYRLRQGELAPDGAGQHPLLKKGAIRREGGR